MTHNPSFYTVGEMSTLLRCHQNTVRSGIKSGRIQAFRVGAGKKAAFRIPSSEIMRMAVLDMEEMLNKKKDK